jgi:hypothetical protein
MTPRRLLPLLCCLALAAHALPVASADTIEKALVPPPVPAGSPATVPAFASVIAVPPADLAAYKQQREIGAGAWKLPEGQAAEALERQRQLPRKYAIRTRLIHDPRDPDSRVLTLDSTAQARALGEGYVVRVVSNHEGWRVGRTTMFSWLGLIPVQEHEAHGDEAPGFINLNEATSALTRVAGRLPEVAKLAPGYAFGFDYDMHIEFLHTFKRVQDAEPKLTRNTKDSSKKRDCTVGARIPAASLTPGLAGDALRVDCTGTEDGKVVDPEALQMVYLEAYAQFFPAQFFGSTMDVPGSTARVERRVQIIPE